MTQQDHIQESREAKQQVSRKILAIGHSLGWGEPQSPEDYNWPRWKVNLNKVNGWILKYGVHKKELHKLSLKELNEVCTQFQQAAKHMINEMYK